MSSNIFERVKKVNKRDSLIVYGYLRECEKDLFSELRESNPYYNLPEIMQNVCLIYYHIADEWDPKYVGVHHKLTKDRLCIENISKDDDESSSYGTLIASSPGIYKWKLRLNHVPNLNYSYWAVIIGIWKTKSSKEPVLDTSFASITTKKTYPWSWGYAFDAMNGTLVNSSGTNAKTGGEYGKKCKTGDIIEIILDFDKLTLKFNINDQDMGIAHSDIEDTEYRVALSTGFDAPIIEMIP